ncbi:MAG: hypothetical protein GY727_11590 [Gammaproteobacteria bacterium]|nr:hypothetical protein [Gammaproteobacteria bacterium]MCP4830955.1 hypothetical protein [Gammaproteobacteria bacterium]MCP4927524.1 hypothetical protein [Gammaproteobacteria bacterium]
MKVKLGLWEVGCVLWVCIAGSLLHFAFELTEFWTPMALFAAVNESAWEHSKMYFWPGVVYALVQYTYTRDQANNYWLGKVVALGVTPLMIFVCYFSYMSWALSSGVKPNLAIMLSIMVGGISAGQFASYKILTAHPVELFSPRYVTAAFATLIFMFSTFTFLPPKVFLFEHFACYKYTGEFGILPDYEPYRVFAKVDENGEIIAGGGTNYCKTV